MAFENQVPYHYGEVDSLLLLMEQPGQALLTRESHDERVHQFINYLWEAFFLPRHLMVLAGGSIVLTVGILILAGVEYSFPMQWGIPVLLVGAAVLEWRFLKQLSQEPAFVRGINEKYRKEISLFLELEQESLPQQASPTTLELTPLDGEGRRLSN